MFPSEHLATASATGCCACRWCHLDGRGMQSQLNDVKRYFGADIQRMLQEFEALGLCCSWLMLFDAV